MVATETFIGQPVLRKEDPELLTGQAGYIDNLTMPGMAVDGDGAPALRARDDRLDRHGAAACDAGRRRRLHRRGPRAWARCRSCGRSPRTSRSRCTTRSPPTRSGSPATPWRWWWPRRASRPRTPPRWSSVEATELPAVTDLREAAKDEAIIHDDLGTNVVVHWSHGGAGDQYDLRLGAGDRAGDLRPATADPQRDGASRAASPTASAAMDEWTLVSATQIPHIAKVTLAGVVGIPEPKLRVIAPDVGGGFGSKLNVYAEEALALALAKRLGPPGEVDRGAPGELRGHDPRPRRDARLHAGRHRGRQDPRR